MDWESIYSEALETRNRIIASDSFLVDAVKISLCRLEDIDIAFLNAVGLFNYPRLVNAEELDYILPKANGRMGVLAPFFTGLVSALSTTITDGGNMACAAFVNFVKRQEFSTIMRQMVQSILASIASNPKSIPSVRHKLSSAWVNSILSCAGGGFEFIGPFTHGDELRQSIEACLETLQPDSEILDLSNQLHDLKEAKKTELKTLFNIRFSDETVDLIRKSVFYSSISRNYPNRCRIAEAFESAGISESEMMLLSMFCFAQTQEKDENRNFWPQFQQWFGFPEDIFKLNSLRNSCVKAFEGIEALKGDRNTHYVQTSLMHSIVSNRPMSVQNMYKAFERQFRRNGYVGHTRDDIEFMMTEMMESAGLNIPSETRNAYGFNPDQTVRFLIDQYGHYETSMLELLGYEPILDGVSDRFAITDYIDRMVTALSQDESKTRKLKSTADEDRGKAGRFHSPYVILDEAEQGIWNVSVCFGYYNLNDEDLKDSDSAIVIVNNKVVASLEIIDGEIVGEKILLDSGWLGQRVSLVVGKEEIDAVNVQDNLLFDFATHKLVTRRLMKNCRHYLLVADPKDFSFDDAVHVGTSSLPGMEVYDITLDEDNFILLNGGIVGLADGDSISHDFLDTMGIAVDAAVVSSNDLRMPIRREWPKINLIVKPDDEVIVNVNGHSVSYSEESRFELKDGSGRLYKKISVSETFPNIRETDISVFVEGSRRLHEKFYALKGFLYSLDKSAYEPDDRVTVTRMEFDDMRTAFGQKHYAFPGRYETLKFKLSDGNAITITPPVFRFSLGDGGIIEKDMAASSLTEHGLFSGCTAGLDKDMRISLENDDGICGWLRKAKGGLWDCSAVMTSNKGKFGLFRLVSYSLGIRYEICNVYFCPTATDQSIRFHSNRNIRTGREDGLYYHCRLLGYTDISKLSFRLCDSNGTVVDQFSSDSSEIYRRLTDTFREGRYTIVPVEKRRSLRSGIVEQAYDNQEPVVYEGAPINGDLVVRITSAVVSGEKTPRDVKRSGIVFRGRIRRKPIKGNTVEMDGSFHICNQFMDRDIDLRVNPCTATINYVTGESIGIGIRDVNGRQLGIDERNFINPERPTGKTRDIKSLFGTYEIKERKG